MKKNLLIFCLLMTATGCLGSIPVPPQLQQITPEKNDYWEHYTSKYSAQEYYDMTADAFKKKYPTKMKELFCQKVKDTHDLDSEIAAAFDFIDGNIVSYFDDRHVSTNGGAIEDGKFVNLYADGCIWDITTDKGERYRIYFFARLKYPDVPEEVGLQDVIVEHIIKEDTSGEEETEEITIGEYFKGNYGV